MRKGRLNPENSSHFALILKLFKPVFWNLSEFVSINSNFEESFFDLLCCRNDRGAFSNLFELDDWSFQASSGLCSHGVLLCNGCVRAEFCVCPESHDNDSLCLCTWGTRRLMHGRAYSFPHSEITNCSFFLIHKIYIICNWYLGNVFMLGCQVGNVFHKFAKSPTGLICCLGWGRYPLFDLKLALRQL